MDAAALLERLEGVRQTGDGRWVARCPAHDDKSPSLSVRELGDGRILLHCFAGCEALEILAAVDLKFSDLFPERLHNHAHPAGSFPPSRHPFAAADTLLLVAREALLLKIAASDISADKPLSEPDLARVQLAADRLWQACAATGSW